MTAWTAEDEKKPWGCEVAFLLHLAADPALNQEQAMMLRHCAKRIESTATQPAEVVVPDGYVLVPVILPPLAVSKIKDHLAEEHQVHSALAYLRGAA